MPPSVACAIRNKHTFRSVCCAGGVPAPRFLLLTGRMTPQDKQRIADAGIRCAWRGLSEMPPTAYLIISLLMRPDKDIRTTASIIAHTTCFASGRLLSHIVVLAFVDVVAAQSSCVFLRPPPRPRPACPAQFKPPSCGEIPPPPFPGSQWLSSPPHVPAPTLCSAPTPCPSWRQRLLPSMTGCPPTWRVWGWGQARRRIWGLCCWKSW